MKAFELIAKLEDGFVLEFYQQGYPYRPDSPLDKEHFMGLYQVPAGTYAGGQPYAAYYCRFGWGSALGTIKDALMLILESPEQWDCLDKKPEDYMPDLAALPHLP